MESYTLQHILESTERYKLYVLFCHQTEILGHIAWLESNKIQSVNIGKEISAFISDLNDQRYLDLEVLEYTKKILESNKKRISNLANEVVAVYNLGILFEPLLEINVSQLFKEFSKTTAIIILWENQSNKPNHLHWKTQTNEIFLDFTETPLKKLQYAI